MTIAQNRNLVTLKYVLSQLPSSQHRAGLAGLVLMVSWLQAEPEFKSLVDAELKITDLDADTVTLQFNSAGLTALMKSHFSAGFEERESKKIRTKSKQKYREIQRKVRDPDTDTTKLTTFYIYTDIVPQADLVQSFEPANSDNLVWTKLWQEVTWVILRPRDKQRLPFKAMVNGTEPSEIEKIWKLLRDRPDANVRLSSTYMLGAQAKNNEGVPIYDRARFYFFTILLELCYSDLSSPSSEC